MIRLLEREPLLASMLAALNRATSGRGGTVLVEGEAGIGKTSLLQEFAARAAGGSLVAWGWCEALVTPRPLGPLQDMGRALDPKVGELLEQGASPDRLFPAEDRVELTLNWAGEPLPEPPDKAGAQDVMGSDEARHRFSVWLATRQAQDFRLRQVGGDNEFWLAFED